MVAQPSGPKGRPTPTINITPLVDVALVVLIIFMVVAPMLEKTLSLSLPPPPDDKSPPAETKDEPLVMTLDASGTMRINREVVARDELPRVLPRMLAATKHKTLHVDAADDLPYGEVVDAVDASRAAGARSIAMVTKKLPDGRSGAPETR
jgi:biopolymer transport protein ExbD